MIAPIAIKKPNNKSTLSLCNANRVILNYLKGPIAVIICSLNSKYNG
jgi:hypothetical protein